MVKTIQFVKYTQGLADKTFLSGFLQLRDDYATNTLCLVMALDLNNFTKSVNSLRSKLIFSLLRLSSKGRKMRFLVTKLVYIYTI